MTETRVLRITGDALKGTKRSTRKGQKGGYDDVPGPVLSHAASSTPAPQLMRGGSAPRPPPLILVEPKPEPKVEPQAQNQVQKGGKLDLAPKKLDLAPKKEKLALVKGKRQQTRKVVKIQMGNLRKSMRRAKDITADSKEKKIEEIEEILVKAGIIRKRDGPMSEGKQKTIRDIYRDYLQLRLNAL
jgi:hypothetical protein